MFFAILAAAAITTNAASVSTNSLLYLQNGKALKNWKVLQATPEALRIQHSAGSGWYRVDEITNRVEVARYLGAAEAAREQMLLAKRAADEAAELNRFLARFEKVGDLFIDTKTYQTVRGRVMTFPKTGAVIETDDGELVHVTCKAQSDWVNDETIVCTRMLPVGNYEYTSVLGEKRKLVSFCQAPLHDRVKPEDFARWKAQGGR